jgi:hypothetical protein
MLRSRGAFSTTAASLVFAIVATSGAVLAQPTPAPVAAVGASGEAQDADAVRIVLVTNHADAEIMPLLRAELEELGLDVQVVDKGENEVVPRDLGRAARSVEAVAGIRVIVAKGVVEVWVADRVTGKVSLREIITQPTQSVSDRATVVLRAVELLRVSLMELDAPHQPRGEIAPPAALRAITGFPEEKGIFGLDVGAGILWTSPDVGPWPALYAGARWRVHRLVDLTAFAMPSLAGATISEPEGDGSLSPHLFAAGARLVLGEATDLLQPAFGLSGGVLWIRMRGDAAVPRTDFSFDAVSPLLLATGTLGFRLNNYVRLWITSESGVSFRPAEVVFGRRVVAKTSHGVITAMGGLEVAVP